MTQSSYGKSYFLSVVHKTTNLACINTSKLKAFPGLIPPVDAQQRIVTALRVVDGELEVESRRHASIDALFQTLLHNLMTGQVAGSTT